MSDDMVRCSACGTPHGSIEDATVCCEKDKPGVVGPKVEPKRWKCHACGYADEPCILIDPRGWMEGVYVCPWTGDEDARWEADE